MSPDSWALVVEGDAHSLIAIASLLKELGIRYKRNTTGAAVVEMALAMKPQPALILLDLNLPYADSFHILTTLKRHRVLRSIPVIALTSDDAERLASRSYRAGFAAFLHKPLPRKKFGTVLQRVLAGESVWPPS